MILEQLSILNYKNIEQAQLTLSPNVNCLIGANGQGKTNVLDAIYFLSFGKSATALTDGACVRHDAEFMMLQGKYRSALMEEEEISCGISEDSASVCAATKKSIKDSVST